MQRVLVIYASKHGSTHEIAEAIADELRASELDAVCVDAGDLHELDADAVVLGSAVYLGRWRREARRVLKRHGGELAALPFWVFSSGPVGDPEQEDDGDERWLEPQHTIAEAVRLGVRDHVVFGGSLPSEPHGFVERAMQRGTPEEHRDRRDWDQVRSWARAIAAEVRAAEAAPRG